MLSSATPALSSDLRDLLQSRLEQANRIGLGRTDAEVTALGPDELRTKGIQLQVFISLGMPEASLRAYFSQAKAIGPDKVRFMLRGFHPKQVALTIARLRALFPEPLDDDFIIDVDPPAFQEMKVTTVPVILVRVGEEKEDRWLRLDGERSLTGALDVAKNPSTAIRLKSAPLYPIEEPDTLALIEEIVRREDWASRQSRIQDQIQRLEVSGHALPKAQQSRQRWHEPRVEIPEDVEVNGIVLARAGQTINPLQYQPLDATILVIDGKDPLHLRWASKKLQDLKREGRAADVFVSAQGRLSMEPIVRRLKDASGVYQIFPALADAFGVQAVPAIIEPHETRLWVREYAAQDLARELRGP
jgi:conjugal transfer pilus assembly protein TraW